MERSCRACCRRSPPAAATGAATVSLDAAGSAAAGPAAAGGEPSSASASEAFDGVVSLQAQHYQYICGTWQYITRPCVRCESCVARRQLRCMSRGSLAAAWPTGCPPHGASLPPHRLIGPRPAARPACRPAVGGRQRAGRRPLHRLLRRFAAQAGCAAGRVGWVAPPRRRV